LINESRPSLRPRRRGRALFLLGLVVAAAGIPLFFSGTLGGAEAGFGCISAGLGLAFLVPVALAAQRDVDIARRSLGWALVAALRVPHIAVLAVVGLGMIGFGALMIGYGVGSP
jgi:hypothetical protein